MSKSPALELELPFPPSVNTYWRRRGSRYFITEKGKQYRDSVRWIVKSAPRRSSLVGNLEVHLAVLMPDKRRRDLDNLLKAPLDALEHAGVYEDDSQIQALSIWNVGCEAPGRIQVRIQEKE